MNFKTVEIRGGRGRLCYGEKPFVDLRRGGYLTTDIFPRNVNSTYLLTTYLRRMVSAVL